VLRKPDFGAIPRGRICQGLHKRRRLQVALGYPIPSDVLTDPESPQPSRPDQPQDSSKILVIAASLRRSVCVTMSSSDLRWCGLCSRLSMAASPTCLTPD
jgi:hypothetical protein